jgi:hypothetical protein
MVSPRTAATGERHLSAHSSSRGGGAFDVERAEAANDLDFDQKPNKVPSSTFASGPQNRLVLDGLVWLGAGKN